ncbi:MAG: hypothetical protein AAFW73_11800 [Bacteroidota bacterium]
MKLKLLSGLLLLATLSTAQTLADTQRVALRVYQETADTVYVKVRRNGRGQIKYLEQAYTVRENGRTYICGEHYRLGKQWFRTRFLETREQNKRGKAKLVLTATGSWPEYNQRGQLQRLFNYQNDEKSDRYHAYSFYPDGKFRFLAEFQEEKIQNFLAYHYPNGREFDFGELSNGSGSYRLLDDQGRLCEICREDPEMFLFHQIYPAVFEAHKFDPYERVE